MFWCPFSDLFSLNAQLLLKDHKWPPLFSIKRELIQDIGIWHIPKCLIYNRIRKQTHRILISYPFNLYLFSYADRNQSNIIHSVIIKVNKNEDHTAFNYTALKQNILTVPTQIRRLFYSVQSNSLPFLCVHPPLLFSRSPHTPFSMVFPWGQNLMRSHFGRASSSRKPTKS